MATTFNPADHDAAFVLSGGNLSADDTTSLTGYVNGRATDFKSSGKWYFEITVNANNATFGSNGAVAAGVGNNAAALTGAPGSDPGAACYYPWTGLTFIHGGTGTIQSDTTAGHVMQIAVDLTGNLIWWKINVSTWNNSGPADPATGVGGLSIAAITGPFTPFAGLLQTGSITANFGASAFAFTPPAGFSAWGGVAATPGSFFFGAD